MSFISGKHALVTGGGSGIGAAIAESMANAGAKVTIVGRNAEKLSAVATKIGASQQTADVTNRKQVTAAMAAASADSGPITVLVNNAGVAEAVPFKRMDDAHWDAMLQTNLTGVFNCTRTAIASMLQQEQGRIINIASTASLTGYAYNSAYAAAKHGVLGLTRSLALEFAKKGITVNAVCPGFTNTGIMDDAIRQIVAATGRSADKALAEIVSANPQGRMIEPEEVASAVLWLCEQPSINGQAITIDGGEVL